MKKIDVAVQSYKKPESLIYSLLTLHKYCAKYIDTIWIDDDQSPKYCIDLYNNHDLWKALYPWKIKIRVNDKKSGIFYYTPQMLLKRPFNIFWYCYYAIKKRNPSIVGENDIRYQWAIDSTNKDYLLIIHDDIMIKNDFLSYYLDSINEDTALVGSLGQCWRCPASKKCSPEKIMTGIYPKHWPMTYGKTIEEYKQKRSCRINEWCCLLNVQVARKYSRKTIYFGTSEDLGDTGAYWFDQVIRGGGYKFADPLLNNNVKYYQHCWQGFAGNDVWIHGAKYDGRFIANLIETEYGIII